MSDSLNPTIILDPLKHVMIFLCLLLATHFLAKFLPDIINRYFKKSSERISVDSIQFNFLKHFLKGLIYFCGIGFAFYTIPYFRNLSVSLFASSGIIAVVVGFASQHALGNIVSGTFIAIFCPFRIGDRLKMPGKEIFGVVEDITLRHTVIRTFENKRIIIPNSLMSTEILENANIVDDKICRFVEIGISYDSDVEKAMKIMRDTAENHPLVIDNRTDEEKEQGLPKVMTRVIGFGDSSVNLRAWVWAKDQTHAFEVGCDLNREIKNRFDQEGIEIPFPYRTIVFKNKEKENISSNN